MIQYLRKALGCLFIAVWIVLALPFIAFVVPFVFVWWCIDGVLQTSASSYRVGIE